MIRARNIFLALLAVAAPAAAQQRSLGIFSLWGAFEGPGRCWATSEGESGRPREAARPFAAIGYWPHRGIEGQVHFRLSAAKRAQSAILLRIDDRTFQLIGGGADAWAPDARADAEIVSAMRTGIRMTVETRSERGGLVRDRYTLRGAATAIDAAAIACAEG